MMRIRIDLAAPRRTQWHEYLTRFLLGGAATVATGLIAQHFGAVIGGLFLALPAIFPASATLIEKHESEKKRCAGIPHSIRGRLAAALDTRGAAMGTIGLAGFAWVVWKALPRHSAVVTLAAALAAWLALAMSVWLLRRHLHRS